MGTRSAKLCLVDRVKAYVCKFLCWRLDRVELFDVEKLFDFWFCVACLKHEDSIVAATDETSEVFQVVTEDHLADPTGSVFKGRFFCLLEAGFFIMVVILTLVAFWLCFFLRWFYLGQSILDWVAFWLGPLRVLSREDLNTQYDLVNFSVHPFCVRYCSETSLQVRAANDARYALHRLLNREEIDFSAEKIARADFAPCDLAKF